MKYYAVTEDPRELYHYGVKGMKWGQHIFGDKPKSPGYHRAVKKLKSMTAKASKATVSSVKTVGKTVQKSASQMLYNARAAQEKRFNKAVERSQKRYDKIDQKIDNYYANVKPVRDARKQAVSNAVKEGASAVASFVRRTPGQVAYNVRRKQEQQYQNAVKKAQQRNKLSDALRNLDQEEKYHKQVDRDRKMEALREKHADIMADNDLKTMQKAVKTERNMPKYFQEARTGTLQYGKLSDEQIGRLQNRLALEANTRRLGSTEAPSWREQKKMARRQGYLQGITKGTSAAMEEVARAGVQYGIKNLANRKKLDAASEQKAKREKEANRIKNRKTHSEMREDIKDEAYKAQVESGVHAIQRGAISTRQASRQLQYAKNQQAIKQDKDEAKKQAQQLVEAKKQAQQLVMEQFNADWQAAQRQKQEQIAAQKRLDEEVANRLAQDTRAKQLLREAKEHKKAVTKANDAHTRTEKYKRLKQEQRELANNPRTTREQMEANTKEINAILAEIAKERLRKQKAGMK